MTRKRRPFDTGDHICSLTVYSNNYSFEFIMEYCKHNKINKHQYTYEVWISVMATNIP